MKTFKTIHHANATGFGNHRTMQELKVVNQSKEQGIMNANKSKLKKLAWATAATVASIAGFSTVRPASAAVVNLTNLNSTAAVNTTSGPDILQSWTVDGSQMINQGNTPVDGSTFYYAVGSGGQSPITSLGLNGAPISSHVDSTGAGTDYVAQKYGTAGGIQAQLTYNLIGSTAGSKTSEIVDTAKITNTTSGTITVHMYEYNDFALGGVNGNESGTITGGNTATVTNPGDFTVVETLRSPQPNSFSVGTYPNLFNTVSNPTVSASPLNDNASVSNADLVYALEWDAVLNPGYSLTVGLQKNITAVPEPTSTVALLGLGGMFLTRPRRRDDDPDARTVQVAEA